MFLEPTKHLTTTSHDDDDDNGDDRLQHALEVDPWIGIT